MVCVILPVQISFYDDNEFMTIPSLVLYIIIIVFYWADIIFRLRTSKITSDFHEITDSRAIAKAYITTLRFWRHIVSSLPLLTLGYLSDDSYYRTLMVNLFIRLLDIRLYKLEKIMSVSIKKVWRLMLTIAQFTLLVIIVQLANIFVNYILLDSLDYLRVVSCSRGSFHREI